MIQSPSTRSLPQYLGIGVQDEIWVRTQSLIISDLLEVFKLNEVIKIWIWFHRNSVLIKKEVMLGITLSTCIKERPHEDTETKEPSISQEESPRQKANFLAIWLWTSSFQNWENKFLLFIPPDILLRKTKQINAIMCIVSDIQGHIRTGRELI